MRSYSEHLEEVLQDPEAKAEYLTAALEDGSVELVTLALLDVLGYTQMGTNSSILCDELAEMLRNVKYHLANVGLKLVVEER